MIGLISTFVLMVGAAWLERMRPGHYVQNLGLAFVASVGTDVILTHIKVALVG